MTRDRITYTDAHAPHQSGKLYDADIPEPGYYRFRLRSGAALCGVRIWYGPPADPVTGEIMDRSWRLQAEVNGVYTEWVEVWPKCADQPIAKSEYEHFCAVQAWARENAPDSPQADPRRKVDALSSPLLF